MGKIAFVFSGQGAQYGGMGKELYEISPAAKKVFDDAERIRNGTLKQCFEASKEELSKTANTQPCLYCVGLAAAQVLTESGISPDSVAGFSLGEIAALTFAGVFSPKDGFSFVCRRGQAMNRAAEKTNGAMTAVLKLDNKKVEEICAHYQNVYPVNYNCPGQLVVAGGKQELALFSKEVDSAGGKTLPLAVSGGFHSPFMDEAVAELADDVDKLNLGETKFPVYSNYTAQIYGNDANKTKERILKQINHPVRWQQIIENMHKDGINTFIEVGAGKTLCGLIKKILPEAIVLNVENKESLENTIKNMS